MTTVTARFLTKIRIRPALRAPVIDRTAPHRAYRLTETCEVDGETWHEIRWGNVQRGWVREQANGVRTFREPVI